MTGHGLDLTDADFSEGQVHLFLNDSTLVGARFTGVTELSGSLTGGVVRDVDFSGAIGDLGFRPNEAERVVFDGAELNGATFACGRGAGRLTAISLRKAKLERVDLCGPFDGDLTGATVSGSIGGGDGPVAADLTDANASGTLFSSDLTGMTLVRTDLRGARFVEVRGDPAACTDVLVDDATVLPQHWSCTTRRATDTDRPG